MQSNQEYDQKKRECWEEFIDEAQSKILGRYEIFCAVFDRAYALSKQEKDAEDTVIQGWVARDKNGDLFMYSTKPEWDRLTGMWYGERALITPSNDLFPDLTWESEPESVEIVIKRKKNANNSTDNRI